LAEDKTTEHWFRPYKPPDISVDGNTVESVKTQELWQFAIIGWSMSSRPNTPYPISASTVAAEQRKYLAVRKHGLGREGVAPSRRGVRGQHPWNILGSKSCILVRYGGWTHKFMTSLKRIWSDN